MADVGDVLIVGQGLAGTTLAWRLLRAGVKPLIVDRGDRVTSSRIAAGLITPITGQRLAKTWQLDTLFPVAESFYLQLEQELGTHFYLPRRMVRIFLNDEERRIYNERADNTFAGWVTEPNPPLKPEWFSAPRGAFEMPRAGQLLTLPYLEASRVAFQRLGLFRQVDLNAEQMNTSGELLTWAEQGLSARRVVFCEGAQARCNPLFNFIRFQPAKGEILTVRIPGLLEDRILHAGIWLVPLGDECFRVGATFQRDRLDCEPTEAGRAELLDQLRQVVRLPVEVLAHEAAVRPVIDAGRPLLGTHPDDDRIGFFNGLGAKGALLAPYFAEQLAGHLLGRTRIDAEVRLGLPVVQPATGPRLTEQAQQAVRAVLRAGEWAIDATTGNGRDTRFLAETVGPTGHVLGFDLQPEALSRTAEQLHEQGLTHVTLHCHSHAEMFSVVPASWRGQVGAVMFNLGYLPGGSKEFTTSPSSTVPAIFQAVELLRPGGICTIMAYVGHPGGVEECEAVRQAVRQLPAHTVEVLEPPERGPATAPKLFILRKRPSGRGNDS